MINLIELMQNMIDLTHYGTIHTHTIQWDSCTIGQGCKKKQHCTVYDGKGYKKSLTNLFRSVAMGKEKFPSREIRITIQVQHSTIKEISFYLS